MDAPSGAGGIRLGSRLRGFTYQNGVMVGRSRFVANALDCRYSDFTFKNHNTRLGVPFNGHVATNRTANNLRDDEGRVGGGCEEHLQLRRRGMLTKYMLMIGVAC